MRLLNYTLSLYMAHELQFSYERYFNQSAHEIFFCHPQLNHKKDDWDNARDVV